MKPYALRALIAVVVSLLLGGMTIAAAAGTALQSIEPSTISLGGSAQLSITSIGSDMPAITPPMVPGLEFLAVDPPEVLHVLRRDRKDPAIVDGVLDLSIDHLVEPHGASPPRDVVNAIEY